MSEGCPREVLFIKNYLQLQIKILDHLYYLLLINDNYKEWRNMPVDGHICIQVQRHIYKTVYVDEHICRTMYVNIHRYKYSAGVNMHECKYRQLWKSIIKGRQSASVLCGSACVMCTLAM